MFFVVDGALQVLVDDEVKLLEKGDFLPVPPHTPHAFAAAPGREADVQFVCSPGMPRFDHLRARPRPTARGP